MSATREKVAMLRARYPEGMRVRLVSMEDTQAPKPGTLGRITFVDDMGDIHIAWDTGSSLAVIPGIDEIERA